MDKQKIALEIFNEMAKDGEPVTMEEALEMAQYEINRKENNKHYVQNAEKKPRKPKTVKISNEKVEIFSEIAEFLKEKYEIEVETDNKLLKIYKNGKEFKLNLSETRQKK